MAASALPTNGNVPEIAAVLILGALALLAGHGWGLMVVVVADVALLGRIWPLVIHDWPPSPLVHIATYMALAGALPGLFLLRRTLPRLMDELLGWPSSPRLRWAGVNLGSGLALVWLTFPIVQALR